MSQTLQKGALCLFSFLQDSSINTFFKLLFIPDACASLRHSGCSCIHMQKGSIPHVIQTPCAGLFQLTKDNRTIFCLALYGDMNVPLSLKCHLMFRSVWCEVVPVSKLYWYKTKEAIPKTNPSTELHSDHYKEIVVGIWKWTLSPFIMLPCKCYNTWQITHFFHQSKTFLPSHTHQFTFYVHCAWWKTYLHLLPRHVAEACHCVAVCPSVASLAQTLWGCRSPRCPLQLHTAPSLPRPMGLPRCSGRPQAEGPQSPCPVFSSLSQREKENTERPSCGRANVKCNNWKSLYGISD